MPTNRTNSFRLFEQERERTSTMTAALNARLVNIRKKNIADSLSDFEGSAHKLEYVKSLNGIDFIDDSRSTNSNAVWFALQSMTKPTVWITNIDEAENLTEDLLNVVREKVKCIVLQGVYNTEVYECLSSLDIPMCIEMNIDDAVREAYYSGKGGYVILFSPGVNGTAQVTYRERGNRFQKAVGQL